MLTRDIRQEPEAPVVMLTLPLRLLLLELGRESTLFKIDGVWQSGRAGARPFSDAIITRAIALRLVIRGGKYLANVRLSGEGAWHTRTLHRRMNQDGTLPATPATWSNAAQEPARQAQPQG